MTEMFAAGPMRSISDSWNVLSQHFPQGVELPDGATAQAILLADGQLGVTLPTDLQELDLAHNGTGTAFVYPVDSTGDTHRIYPIEAAIGTYGAWSTLTKSLEGERRRLGKPSIPETSWWKKDWLPVTASRGADGIFVDFSSEFSGLVCQVTNCWYAGTEVTVLAKDSWTWLDQLDSRLWSEQYTFDSPCPSLSSGPMWR